MQRALWLHYNVWQVDARLDTLLNPTLPTCPYTSSWLATCFTAT